jgi:hypothetical protein
VTKAARAHLDYVKGARAVALILELQVLFVKGCPVFIELAAEDFECSVSRAAAFATKLTMQPFYSGSFCHLIIPFR